MHHTLIFLNFLVEAEKLLFIVFLFSLLVSHFQNKLLLFLWHNILFWKTQSCQLQLVLHWQWAYFQRIIKVKAFTLLCILSWLIQFRLLLFKRYVNSVINWVKDLIVNEAMINTLTLSLRTFELFLVLTNSCIENSN